MTLAETQQETQGKRLREENPLSQIRSTFPVTQLFCRRWVTPSAFGTSPKGGWVGANFHVAVLHLKGSPENFDRNFQGGAVKISLKLILTEGVLTTLKAFCTIG